MKKLLCMLLALCLIPGLPLRVRAEEIGTEPTMAETSETAEVPESSEVPETSEIPETSEETAPGSTETETAEVLPPESSAEAPAEGFDDGAFGEDFKESAPPLPDYTNTMDECSRVFTLTFYSETQTPDGSLSRTVLDSSDWDLFPEKTVGSPYQDDSGLWYCDVTFDAGYQADRLISWLAAEGVFLSRAAEESYVKTLSLSWNEESRCWEAPFDGVAYDDEDSRPGAAFKLTQEAPAFRFFSDSLSPTVPQADTPIYSARGIDFPGSLILNYSCTNASGFLHLGGNTGTQARDCLEGRHFSSFGEIESIRGKYQVSAELDTAMLLEEIFGTAHEAETKSVTLCWDEARGGWRFNTKTDLDTIVDLSGICAEEVHLHGQEVCQPLTEPDLLSTPGSWYLTQDITLDGPLHIQEGKVDLCLNGCTLSAPAGVQVSGSLTIRDCTGAGGLLDLGESSLLADGDLVLESGGIRSQAAAVEVGTGSFQLQGGSICGDACDILLSGPEQLDAAGYGGEPLNLAASPGASLNPGDVLVIGCTDDHFFTFAPWGEQGLLLASDGADLILTLPAHTHDGSSQVYGEAVDPEVHDWAEGAYYLASDMEAGTYYSVTGAVTLCLNGCTLNTTAIHVREGASLTIRDCGGTGMILSDSSQEVIQLHGGELCLESGEIQYSGEAGDVLGTVQCIEGSNTVSIRGGCISGSAYALALSSGADRLYLSGTPELTGGAADLLVSAPGQISAQEEGTDYTGGVLTLDIADLDAMMDGALVKNVTEGINDDLFTCQAEETELHLEGTDLILGKHTHSFGSEVIVQPASCTQSGQAVQSCGCGKTQTRSLPIDPSSHLNTEDHPQTDAACEASGYTAGTYCKDCGRYIRGHDPIPEAGHSWGSPAWTWNGTRPAAVFTCGRDPGHREAPPVTVEQSRTPATCDEAGAKIYTASVTLGAKTYTDTKTDPMPATGHRYGAPVWRWNERYAAEVTVTCANGHQQTLPASVTSAVSRQPGCRNPGRKIYTATVTVDGTTHTQSRSAELPALGHQGPWQMQRAATCTEKGREDRYCTRCGAHEARETAALGHAYGDPLWTWEGDRASAAFTCARDEGHSRVIPAKVTVETINAPSCTENGEGIYAASISFDGRTYTATAEAPHVITAPGHSWSPWALTGEADCERDGEEKRTCARCGMAESRTVEAGHSWSSWYTSKQPTCRKPGAEKRRCSRCGETQTRSLPALGHDWGSWQQLSRYRYRHTCRRCGTRETGPYPGGSPKTGDSIGLWSTVLLLSAALLLTVLPRRRSKKKH